MHHCILPPTTERCRQLIHYHWVPFLFPSPSLCHTHWVPSCCPPPTTLTHWSVSVWKPYYVLLLDLQTQLDRELQSRPEPVLCLNYVFAWVWIQLHTSLFACVQIPVCIWSAVNESWRGSISLTVPRWWDFPLLKHQVTVAALQFGRADDWRPVARHTFLKALPGTSFSFVGGH